MREFFESLARRAASAGDKCAIVSASGPVSYAALIGRVRAHAQWAAKLPDRVGLLFAKGADHLVCDLALSFAGKEIVPLPEFFSDAQLSHIVRTAQLCHIVSDAPSIERAKRLGLTAQQLGNESTPDIEPSGA